MIYKNIHFVFDKTTKSKSCKNFFIQKYKNTSIKKAEIIVVVGGDGFMLNTIKKFENLKKPFFGINKGSYGFLMNKFSKKDIFLRLNKTKKIIISPLKANLITKNNKNKSSIAINEVSLFRQTRQTASLEIKLNKKTIIKKLVSDGVLVSTPAGSTAYNFSVHGPILSLDSKNIAVTPISPFRPRKWKGLIVSAKNVIKIKNLDIKKRPISAVADNNEFRNIKEVMIKIDKKRKFTLLYDKNNSLFRKNKFEQNLNKKP
mgnify:CR=1 FL=1